MDAVKMARLQELWDLHSECDGEYEHCPLSDEERQEMGDLEKEAGAAATNETRTEGATQ
jgi:hypothetical protein